MKFLKKNWSNFLFVAILLVIFFTPIGFQFKVLVNRYIHFSPTEIAKEEQVTLANYNWNLRNDSGLDIDFNQFKNKVILINFWATWCPPCVAEMPSFQKLYIDYEEEVVLLFIANDQQEKVASFMEKYDYSFSNYYEKSSTPPQLSSSSLPTTYLLDKGGNIVMTKTGAANWNSDKIRKLLDELINE